MNAVIIHESRGRMRLQCRLKQKEMSLAPGGSAGSVVPKAELDQPGNGA